MTVLWETQLHVLNMVSKSKNTEPKKCCVVFVPRLNKHQLKWERIYICHHIEA